MIVYFLIPLLVLMFLIIGNIKNTLKAKFIILILIFEFLFIVHFNFWSIATYRAG